MPASLPPQTVPGAVLVTGAGSGIGRACALAIARAGFATVAGVYDEEQATHLAEASRDCKHTLQIVRLDVTDPSALARAVRETGPFYGVVNSAGLGLRGFFEDLTEEEIQAVYDVNVFGSMAVARAVLPDMRRAGRGRLLFVSSAGGRVPSMGISGYSSGKFALEGFAESLAIEVAPFGINVSLIEPGLVFTPHFTKHRGRARKAMDPKSPYYAWFVQHEHLVDEILLERRITPEDVAATALAALQAPAPRLHYVVGRFAKAAVGLRRHLPDRWFERLYFRTLIARVIKPKRPVSQLRELTLAKTDASDEDGRSQ